jgi:SAM-dependent methyltransferase
MGPGVVLAVAIVAPTIGLSAFLLFAVEPLIGRLTLPAFGGAPGVWATILAFFQAILLLGYLYGHLSVTRLGLRRGALVHLVLAAAAGAALAFAPVHVGDLRNEALAPVVNLIAILAVTIGPAAFVLTATTPLLSAWYVALAGRDGRAADPYWLYALSNAGSFAALLAYPFLIEPTLGLANQRLIWTIGFGALWLLLAGGSALVWVRARPSPANASTGATFRGPGVRAIDSVDAKRRLRWVLLAAIPSGLLAAVTNVIAADLISAPLLWVGPLSIYLLTFVIAFSERGRRVVPRARWLAPVAITLLWVPFGSIGGWPILPLLLVEYGGFAITALALHGRLALDRPSPARLTEFYVLLAAGGVIGGAFVAILAPLVFKGIWEFPILLVGGLAVLAWEAPGPRAAATPLIASRRRFDLRPFVRGAPGRLGPYLAVAVPLGLALAMNGAIGLEVGLRWLLVGGLILLVGAQPRFLAISTALVLAISIFVIPRDVVFGDRSFFGVTEVLRPPGAGVTSLMNGTTLHGVQSSDPLRRRAPLGYYTRLGPLGDVFGLLDEASPDARLSVGVVGLGAGALATYERPGDLMTFYEIDPVVVRVASDPTYFTFLSDAPTRPSIVLGDARLSLKVEPAARYDILVLDAFSSDSIPVHLLTAEAFTEYGRVVKPGGLLAVHVSNRYYDLVPPVAAAAQRAGLTALVRRYQPTESDRAHGAVPSIWVVATSDPRVLAGLSERGWQPVSASAQPFTDDFTDLLRYMQVSW